MVFSSLFRCSYRAVYKYRPQNADELELQEGDIVYVLEKCDDGWFVGTSQRSGCFGTFPGNYVERLWGNRRFLKHTHTHTKRKKNIQFALHRIQIWK